MVRQRTGYHEHKNHQSNNQPIGETRSWNASNNTKHRNQPDPNEFRRVLRHGSRRCRLPKQPPTAAEQKIWKSAHLESQTQTDRKPTTMLIETLETPNTKPNRDGGAGARRSKTDEAVHNHPVRRP
ncbi:hypothetical protein A2U01_0007155 [Trifolium medium]|uniref:Uncharacterized protein n=1 Tax=Trifolium medium TaxID=97028 RepID=A0A392MG63_9FABA|nr:hypothetical protein [Trifolium medium]